MGYVLGIDQGGSSTRAAIMDHLGNIYGYGTAEGTYFPKSGLDVAMSIVERLVQRVLLEASIHRDLITETVAGISGIDWPEDAQTIAAVLEEKLKLSNIEAHNDCVIAMFSGTQNRYGAALCAGSGINAVIIRPDGQQFVMSDYLGPELQGGGALSYRALRKVFDSDLGLVPPTMLTQLFLDFAGFDKPYDLLKESMVNSDVFLRSIVKLFPEILSIAEKGDEVTIGLLSNFTDELCNYFIAGLRKMDMLGMEFDIVLAGSIFKGIRNGLVENIVNRLTEAIPKVRIVNAKYEPVVGACVMGFLHNNSFTQEVSDRLETSARKFGLVRTEPDRLHQQYP